VHILKQPHTIFNTFLARCFVGIVAIATIVVVPASTQTSALTLDVSGLTNTVSLVVENVPIVNQLIPVAPSTSPMMMTSPTSANAARVSPETETAPASNDVTENTRTNSARSTEGLVAVNTPSILENDVIAKQSEIALASAHVESPAVSYDSRQLNSKTATALFYSGVGGICLGVAALVFIGRKMGTA